MNDRYLVQMLEMLTSAYDRRDLANTRHGRPLESNIGKLFSLLADGLEAIHRNAELVRLWDDLDRAEGAVLDRYGANFGVQRGAASDLLYRIFIRVKMMAQVSGGDDDTVIRASAELLGVAYEDICLEEVFPAKIALYVDQTLLSEERLELIDQIAYAIKRILAAGIGMRLYLRTYRTYRQEMPVYQGAAASVIFWPLPVPQDRAGRSEIPVCRGSCLSRRILCGDAPTKDRSFSCTLDTAHGCFIPQALSGVPPDTERSTCAAQEGARSAVYHTHLKPRRID